MKIVFLNRFEYEAGHVTAREGQVFIGEERGTWTAGWNGHPEQGDTERDVWYEGTSWEELLSAFRHGVAGKMREGYRPLLDGMLEDRPFWERKPKLQSLLLCYADHTEAKEELLEPLRQWRRAKSAEEKRPAYLVATNRELQLLAVYVPQTLVELEQIPGFGRLKTQRYGDELVVLLGGIERKHAYPLDWVEKEVTEAEYAEWTFRQKEERYGKTLSHVREKRELLASIREGMSLAELAVRMSCVRRDLVERIERLDDEGYDVLGIVDLELAAIPAEEKDQAFVALDEMGDRYLKPLQQRVYGAVPLDSALAEQQYERLRLLRIRYRHNARIAV